MIDPAFFQHPTWWRLAAVQGHFLWQGLLIGWLYWTLVRVGESVHLQRRGRHGDHRA